MIRVPRAGLALVPNSDRVDLAATGAGALPARSCPHCGGSGILRTGDQQFRTCLPCLGLGRLGGRVVQIRVDENRVAQNRVAEKLQFPPKGSGLALATPDEEDAGGHHSRQGHGGEQQQDHGGPVGVHRLRGAEQAPISAGVLRPALRRDQLG